MNPLVVAGLLLTVAGIAGYAVGIAVPYPARAFSVTAFMVGITLVAVRRAVEAEAE